MLEQAELTLQPGQEGPSTIPKNTPLPFFRKPSKSIMSGAQCVAVTHQKNGLAIFLNKTAVLLHIGLSALFSENQASPL